MSRKGKWRVSGVGTIYRTIMLLFIASIGAGVTGQYSLVSPSSAQTAPVEAAAPASSTDYVLGVADHVRITVYNEPSLSGEYPVASNGTVAMPLIGEVPAKGLTPGQLQSAIQAALANGYLTNPRVAIDVLTFRPYYILGEVNKAGQYPYSAGLTVMNAVATAQGFTYRASTKYVYIKHVGSDQEERVRVTADLPVQPGDTIRIPQRFF